MPHLSARPRELTDTYELKVRERDKSKQNRGEMHVSFSMLPEGAYSNYVAGGTPSSRADEFLITP